NLYVRACEGTPDFGLENHSKARNIILSAMATDIAARAGLIEPEGTKVPDVPGGRPLHWPPGNPIGVARALRDERASRARSSREHVNLRVMKEHADFAASDPIDADLPQADLFLEAPQPTTCDYETDAFYDDTQVPPAAKGYRKALVQKRRG